ncbi:hypothetical protein CBW65_09880 [Tumebacillus avium]|uniref:histidine kinase n=1 Tax=Tumebacillus avium TaxID=1903704 RepID=A0A1Y0IL80_9BACL|nr:sensor histidine kinase [Tumebacillus avium]ARU61268.1 hypothetical protein CBW65_09880 [Tumebacillus avium]
MELAELEIRNLLLHLLIVLLPVLLYFTVQGDAVYRRKHQMLVGVLGGTTAMLCLSLPVKIDNVLWDLRMIPLILAVVYGGWRAGLIAAVPALLYRAQLGGGSVWLELAAGAVSLGICFVLARSFLRFAPRQRILLCMLLSFLSFLPLGLAVNASHLDLLLVQGALHILGIGICSYLIENKIQTLLLHRELANKERLNIISELAAVIAHEVKNPLTVVRGFLQLALGSLDEKARPAMQIALTELDRANYIISDYLNFAKPRPESIQVFDVADVVRHIAMVMGAFGTLRGVEIRTDCSEGLLVNADAGQLQQALMNLVKNGIEAIAEPSGTVTIQAFLQGETVLLSVRDTGVGMSAEQLRRMGTPFYTTKTSGTGLGTMVTRKIIEGMKGTLTFHSAPGLGTEAVVKIPAVLVKEVV